MPPPENVSEENIDAAELKGLQKLGNWDQDNAYAREHGQRPATIGLVLSTSPLALLIW